MCHKRYTVKSDVIFHLRVAHDVGEQVRCDVCSETDFSCEADYNKHVNECAVSQSRMMLTDWVLVWPTAADENAFCYLMKAFLISELQAVFFSISVEKSFVVNTGTTW